jgi:hypothetical protein
MSTYLVCILISLALHRLWNYEDVFAGVRPWFVGFKPITCAACNAFWISVPVALGAWLLGLLSPIAAATFPLAAYPILRAAVGLYQFTWPQVTPPTTIGTSSPPGLFAAGTAPATKPGCSSCEAKKAALDTERARTDQFAKRIVILTDQNDLSYQNPLAAWVFAHAVALAKNPKNLVQVWAAEGAKKIPSDLPKNVEVRSLLPTTGDAAKIAAAITDGLIWLGNATIITERLWGSADQPAIAAALDQVGLLSAFAWIHILDPSDGVRPLLPHHVRVRPDVVLPDAVATAQPVPMPVA